MTGGIGQGVWFRMGLNGDSPGLLNKVNMHAAPLLAGREGEPWAQLIRYRDFRDPFPCSPLPHQVAGKPSCLTTVLELQEGFRHES